MCSLLFLRVHFLVPFKKTVSHDDGSIDSDVTAAFAF
jgi:hypothetical protein